MTSESKVKIDGQDEDIPLPEAQFLWEEYKYRHELCWKLIFQITTAVVAILVIPYIRSDITKLVGLLILALPCLAIILVVFGMSRLSRELEILAKIRTAHRDRQRKIQHITLGSDGYFTRDVRRYLIGLIVVCVADIFALVYMWWPR